LKLAVREYKTICWGSDIWYNASLHKICMNITMLVTNITMLMTNITMLMTNITMLMTNITMLMTNIMMLMTNITILMTNITMLVTNITMLVTNITIDLLQKSLRPHPQPLPLPRGGERFLYSNAGWGSLFLIYARGLMLVTNITMPETPDLSNTAFCI
jgi:hypothetical protein